jgi:tetratricopeptide (TPR) repeat protein
MVTRRALVGSLALLAACFLFVAFAAPLSLPWLESVKHTLYSLRYGTTDSTEAYELEIAEWRAKSSWYPRSHAAHFRLGVALASHASGKKNQRALSAEALEAFRVCLALRPDDAPTLEWTGDLHANHFRDYPNALACYQRAFALNPSDGNLRSKLEEASVRLVAEGR